MFAKESLSKITRWTWPLIDLAVSAVVVVYFYFVTSIMVIPHYSCITYIERLLLYMHLGSKINWIELNSYRQERPKVKFPLIIFQMVLNLSPSTVGPATSSWNGRSASKIPTSRFPSKFLTPPIHLMTSLKSSQCRCQTLKKNSFFVIDAAARKSDCLSLASFLGGWFNVCEEPCYGGLHSGRLQPYLQTFNKHEKAIFSGLTNVCDKISASLTNIRSTQ